MRRRPLLMTVAALGPLASRAAAAGAVLILRHAATEPGVGDPPGFVLGRCETQRNLSAEGRAQASAFGALLATKGWLPLAIRSSRWCRCLDTAQGIATALGPHPPRVDPWPALDSFFDDRSREPAQTAELRRRVQSMRPTGALELWVTHQVNITALTGVALAMAEARWLAPARDGGLTVTPFTP